MNFWWVEKKRMNGERGFFLEGFGGEDLRRALVRLDVLLLWGFLMVGGARLSRPCGFSLIGFLADYQYELSNTIPFGLISY